MRQVVVAGLLCADLIPGLSGAEQIAPGILTEVGALRITPGGCVANAGRDLAALGIPVRLVADVGDDELGRLLPQLLRADNVDASEIRAVPDTATSYSLVFEPPGRDRTFWHHVGANAGFDGSRVSTEGIELLHLGYPPILPALYSGGGRALLDLLRRAHGAGAVTSVDLATIDASSPAARIDWRSLLAAALPFIDVITLSVDDLHSVLGGPRPHGPAELRALVHELIGLGAGVVLLTDGPNGLQLCTAGADRLATTGRVLRAQATTWAGHEAYAPAPSVPRAQTIGAGDAAAAGLLYGILTGTDPTTATGMAAAAAALRATGQDPAPTLLQPSVQRSRP